MKNNIIIALVVCLTISPTLSLAQELTDAQREQIQQYSRHFKYVDLDRSGALSRQEILIAATKNHQQLDTNFDRYVQFDEYKNLNRNKSADLEFYRFNQIDLNKDGKISRREARSYADQIMVFDKNSDGILSVAEIIKIAPVSIQSFYKSSPSIFDKLIK